MSRAWSLAVPVVTVLVVAYALFVGGAPRKILGERIYGGPTEGVTELSLRVESVARDGEHESPGWNGPIVVGAKSEGTDSSTTTEPLGTAGVVDFQLRFGKPLAAPVRVHASAPNGEYALGDISLGVQRWAARARRRGGWIRGRDSNGLVISIAPERGAFVVGASDPSLIRVERAGTPVPNARLTLQADGAQLEAPRQLRSDARGRARVSFEAIDLNPTLRVEARTDDGEKALLDSGVPVVPGGLHGLATPTGIRVESSTPRSQAFFSVVSDRARIAGGVLALTPDGHGGSFAETELHLSAPLPSPAWLVVSSEARREQRGRDWLAIASRRGARTNLRRARRALARRHTSRIRARARTPLARTLAHGIVHRTRFPAQRGTPRPPRASRGSRHRATPENRLGKRDRGARGAAYIVAAGRSVARDRAWLRGVRWDYFRGALVRIF